MRRACGVQEAATEHEQFSWQAFNRTGGCVSVACGLSDQEWQGLRRQVVHAMGMAGGRDCWSGRRGAPATNTMCARLVAGVQSFWPAQAGRLQATQDHHILWYCRTMTDLIEKANQK